MSNEVPKVMVVDSDMLHVIDVEDALKSSGFDVVNLTTSNGVLAQVEYEKPDALFVEIEMEGLNASDLFDAIRSQESFDQMVVVIYSDAETKEMEKLCLQHDLNGYYSKKMDLSQLADWLKKLL